MIAIGGIRLRHRWSFLKRKCLHCNRLTRERVVHYFHIVKKKDRVQRWAVRNAEHYLCHSETCIDWRCIKFREEIYKAAGETAREIAKVQLEQFGKVTGP